MNVTYLTRSVRFSAAHRYHRPEWNEARNRAAFGACANEHGHGHNYVLEVTVAGEPDPLTGFCVDLAALDELLREQVREPLDHRHLNHDVPEFRGGGRIPSSENLVVWIWERLASRIPGGAPGAPAPARGRGPLRRLLRPGWATGGGAGEGERGGVSYEF